MSDDVRRAMKDVFEAASRCGFLRESQAVHAEIERLRAEVTKSVEVERKLLEDNRRTEEIIAEKDLRIKELEDEVREGYDRINTPCGEVVDDLFKLVMPEGAADWEYPAQAFRCIKERIEELKNSGMSVAARSVDGESGFSEAGARPTDGRVTDLPEAASRISISAEQIDSAWKMVRGWRYEGGTTGEDLRLWMFIFKRLGIVECEECGGSGERDRSMYQPNGDPTDPTPDECPACHGHGWVMEADDE